MNQKFRPIPIMTRSEKKNRAIKNEKKEYIYTYININIYFFVFSFQMSVEMFDYMDDILNLQRAGRYGLDSCLSLCFLNCSSF